MTEEKGNYEVVAFAPYGWTFQAIRCDGPSDAWHVIQELGVVAKINVSWYEVREDGKTIAYYDSEGRLRHTPPIPFYPGDELDARTIGECIYQVIRYGHNKAAQMRSEGKPPLHIERMEHYVSEIATLLDNTGHGKDTD